MTQIKRLVRELRSASDVEGADLFMGLRKPPGPTCLEPLTAVAERGGKHSLPAINDED